MIMTPYQYRFQTILAHGTESRRQKQGNSSDSIVRDGENVKHTSDRKNHTQNTAQKGTATVEAALILPMVMLAILAVLSIIRITVVYERMQHALNQVAEDMSQYSYLYAVSGLKEKHDKLIDNIDQAQNELLEQQEAVSTFYQSIQSVAGNVTGFQNNENLLNTLDDMLTDLNNVNSSYDTLTGKVEEILADPMGEVRLIGLALSDTLISEAKTALLGAIAKSMLKGRLANDLNLPPREVEQRLRLADGIGNLDFSCSTFFEDKQTIDLIMEYTVKPMPDFFFLPEIRLRNRACVLAWTWGTDRQSKSKEESTEKESIWNYTGDQSYFRQNTGRGITAEDRFSKELKEKLGEHAEATPFYFPVVDVIEYAHGKQPGKLITVFSLNPYLNSYKKKGGALSKIRQKLNELHNFKSARKKDFMIEVSGDNYERIVYIIVPENEKLPEVYLEDFEQGLKEAQKLGIKLIQVQKYGEYDVNQKTPVDKNDDGSTGEPNDGEESKATGTG